MLRAQVKRAAQNRCEYCQAAQDMTLATFHLDHIVPRWAGGLTVFENLCLSCPFCNEFKSGKQRAQDPETRQMAHLFHPRRDGWREHFRWNEESTQIIGLTPSGRATIVALQMNNQISQTARHFWVACGIHPPDE